MTRPFLLSRVFLLCTMLTLTGCVSFQSMDSPTVGQVPPPSIYTLPVPPGIYHQVEAGQTLWSISRNYGVNVSDVMKYNRIKSAQELVARDRIFIPSNGSRLPVEPLYVTRSINWKYIIIHHSATDVGSAESFQKGHFRRGFGRGLGYHFVLDNGSGPTKDGDIEVGRRWFYQMDGAHCQADGMNKQGIGICLVGNFDKEYVTRKQLNSLVALIDYLRLLYNIPLKNIKGHGGVSSATTNCPGRNFPWTKFKQELSLRASSH